MDGHNINNNNTFNSEQSWLNFFLPFFNGTSNRPPSRCPKNSKLLFWTFWTNFLFPLSLTLSLSLLARVVVNVSKATFSLLLCLYVCTPHPTYMISFSVLFAFMDVYCFSTNIRWIIMAFLKWTRYIRRVSTYLPLCMFIAFLPISYLSLCLFVRFSFMFDSLCLSLLDIFLYVIF